MHRSVRVRVILLILTIGSARSAVAQRAMDVRIHRQLHGSTEALDSTHRSAIHVDSTRSVFHGRSREFNKARNAFLDSLGTYLRSNGFTWSRDTRVSTRIYFSPEGSVEYFLCGFPKDALDPVRKERFYELLNEFLAGHDLGLTAEEPFVQCGPVLFKTSVAHPDR